ncbi:hypothetical protein A2397_01120 [Candidatus Amesbacteria bacterium RIFOXYB1_FULL_44_23]|uniref:ACT domain-containing protein n=1 Tax=Candidatus Amesbacteria bacterium RIFOXYB1_FULL_44_23 TaxID=1797263 RepID=A0A1F4ZTL8_9BACT|nr:MAG: hypothetical protein A2397_01120 [Candidatus Amesbacteria bacterium RIFOXYB1_FULL_44_23]
MVSERVTEGLSPDELEAYVRFHPRNKYVGTALGWALIAHRGQRRRSGEMYIEHPMAVVNILAGWGLTQDEFQAAGLVHDTVEDSDTALEDIAGRWGDRVAAWVRGVSKFDSELETLKQVTSRSHIDAGTGLIKLADRLHNMRTLGSMPESKQQAISLETDLVYRELAESLGMWVAREELSDLSFMYLNPEMYAKIGQEINQDPRTRPECYLHLKSGIEALFAATGLNCDVGIRFKGRNSTFEKKERKIFSGECSPNDLLGISDLVSIGVIVNSKEDCYRALERIHNQWNGQVLVDQFKDCIANPAENNYQALQTTIVSPDGPVEVAIMTPEMKAFNNLGIAYRMSIDSTARHTLLKPVFLPSGRALFLPPQSTGVDLLCRVDMSLALKNPVLLIDGKQFPITVVLPVGSTAEVVPTLDSSTEIDGSLFKYCLPISKNKLEKVQLLSQEQSLRNKGQKMLEELLIPRGLLLLEDLGKSLVNKIIRGIDRVDNRVKSIEQLYHLVGGGFLDVRKVTGLLDEFGVTKNQIGLSTILVTGKEDRVGILDLLSGTIANYGGNIRDVHTETENGFEIRIIVKGLNTEGENSIREALDQSKLFCSILVI